MMLGPRGLWAAFFFMGARENFGVFLTAMMSALWGVYRMHLCAWLCCKTFISMRPPGPRIGSGCTHCRCAQLHARATNCTLQSGTSWPCMTFLHAQPKIEGIIAGAPPGPTIWSASTAHGLAKDGQQVVKGDLHILELVGKLLQAEQSGT